MAREGHGWDKGATYGGDQRLKRDLQLNLGNAIYDVKVEKADSFEMFVERNLVLVRSKERVRAIQTTVDANVERKVTLTEDMTKIRKLLESGRSNNRLDRALHI